MFFFKFGLTFFSAAHNDWETLADSPSSRTDTTLQIGRLVVGRLGVITPQRVQIQPKLRVAVMESRVKKKESSIKYTHCKLALVGKFLIKFSSLSAPTKIEELTAGSEEKKHSAAPPGIEPRILRILVARSNH